MDLNSKCKSLISESSGFFDLLSAIVENIYITINTKVNFDEDGFYDLYLENLGKYKKFEKRFCPLIPSYAHCFLDFESIKHDILLTIERTEISIQDDPEQIVASCLIFYWILLASDSAMGKWKIDIFHEFGPLDKNEDNKFRLYFCPDNTINKDYRTSVDRNRQGRYLLYQNFDNMIFFDSEDWKKENKKVPTGIIVSTSRFKNRKELIIGVSNFTYNESNVSEKTRKTSKTRKYISYTDFDQNGFASYVEHTIEKAIENSCDILVFPEYSCSDIIREKVVDSLAFHKNKKEKTPLITIAGSTWTNDDSNVSYAYNECGDELGCYYKWFRFRNEERTYIEDITNLGKECDIYFIWGLGMIMPAICRDVVESGYTDILVKQFFPEIVLVPAYSKSIHDFMRYLTPFAELQFTSSVVAGYCNRVEKEEVGCCYMPFKVKTQAGFSGGYLSRKGCSAPEDCKKGCLQVIKMDFNFCADEKHNVVTNTSLSINGIKINEKK